jgi:hypothetical protein
MLPTRDCTVPEITGKGTIIYFSFIGGALGTHLFDTRIGSKDSEILNKWRYSADTMQKKKIFNNFLQFYNFNQM